MDMTNPTDDDILTRGQANLEANQSGTISAQQKDRIKQDMKVARQDQLRIVYVAGILLFMVTVMLVLLPNLPIPIFAPLLIWMIGFTLWRTYIHKQQQPLRDDLERGRVESVTGYVNKTTKLGGYHVIIHDEAYETPPDMYHAFDETQEYTVYYTPNTRIVLSAERIEVPDDTSPITDSL